MSTHLTDQQLNAYLHQTLSDAQRKTLDAHLNNCPACRARFSEMNGVQQRVQRELAAELKTVNVPLSLTFASTTGRRPQTVNMAWVWRQSGRVLVGLIALAIVALVAASLLGTLHQAAIKPMPTPSSSRVVSTSGYVGGWTLYSEGNVQDYEVGLDYEVNHNGKASGYISSTVSNPQGFGTLVQTAPPERYLGKRVRLSGYVKTDQIDGWAGLWMRIDDPQGAPLSFDNMFNRQIRGTTDWQKYSVVLDVPANSINLVFGVMLVGSGRVWIDDVQLEIVGDDVATTASTEEMSAAATTSTPAPENTPSPLDLAALAQPTNLSFETGTAGWSVAGDTQSYEIGVDSTVTFDGQNSGFIAWDVSQPIGLAKLVQSIQAEPYRTKRVRISAQVKSDPISQWQARYFVAAYAASGEELLSDTRLMHGATWQKYESVFDVPDTATRIEYGIALEGQGRAWLDDVQVEEVGQGVSPTTYVGFSNLQPQLPKGVDLDGTLSNLDVFSSAPEKYQIGFDSTVAHSGRSSAYIKSIAPVKASDFGQWYFGTEIGSRGKHMRLSAYIKAKDVEGWAGLWMQVRGQSDKLLSFDDMRDRAIQGTSDWQKYEVVLDVPDDSVAYSYGITMYGPGEVWLDDVQVEDVGTDVPTTGHYAAQPLNLDFENNGQAPPTP